MKVSQQITAAKGVSGFEVREADGSTEPGAVATGSWTQLSKIMESVTRELNASIRSLLLSVL